MMIIQQDSCQPSGWLRDLANWLRLIYRTPLNSSTIESCDFADSFALRQANIGPLSRCPWIDMGWYAYVFVRMIEGFDPARDSTVSSRAVLSDFVPTKTGL
jgi:hypothetical protein